MIPDIDTTAVISTLPKQATYQQPWLNTIADLVSKTAEKRLLLIGDLMLATLAEPDGAVSWPTPVERHTLGGTAELGATLQDQEIAVTLCGFIGHDIAGIALRYALRQARLNDVAIIEDASIATIHIIKPPDPLQTMISAKPVMRHYSRTGIARLIAAIRSDALAYDALVIDDWGYGIATESVVSTACTIGETHGLPVFIAGHIDRT